MIKFLDSRFESQVNVDADATFEGCEFAAKGANKKDKVFGIEVKGDAALTVKDCKFGTTGYSAIHMMSNGDILLANNDFDCANNYNPVEGAVSGGTTKNVSLVGNLFHGVCGNNYVNFYQMNEGARVFMNNNIYDQISPDSEVLRISNPSNVNVNFNIKGDRYSFGPGAAGDYTSFIMLQDYTTKSGKPEDFSKVNITLEDVLCNDKKVTAEGAAFGKILFVYEDTKGIIDNNNPVLLVK